VGESGRDRRRRERRKTLGAGKTCQQEAARGGRSLLRGSASIRWVAYIGGGLHNWAGGEERGG